MATVELLLRFIGACRTISVPNESRIRGIGQVDSIVILGSTCAGKTTIAESIRESNLARNGLVVVPRRYVTRQRRANETESENIFVTSDEFDRKVAEGAIGLRWIRKMDAGREERYGCESTPTNRFPVYQGGNGIYDNASSVLPRGILRHALFMGIHAPDEVRRERLLRRSPDLVATKPAEVAFRLGQLSSTVIPHVHVLVANHGGLEGYAKQEVVEFLQFLVCTQG